MKICVITDNEFIFNNFLDIAKSSKHDFDFFFSNINKDFLEKYKYSTDFHPIKLKDCPNSFFQNYELFFSLHCKQIFPPELVENHRCINVHPGYNPYNRGWFPQVFSIINKLPIGVTIHEIDNDLDHGPIIYQEKLEILSYETSLDIYRRIQQLEIDLLKEHLEDIINHNYITHKMEPEGNINYKSDFNKLCEIDLKREGTFGEFIDLLRATTFAKYDNAYFIDEHGQKIYVSINLKAENENPH